MTLLALLLGAAVASLCVVLVALPFLREAATSQDALEEPDALELKRIALAEERDRALAALKDLELDHRTGKITDDDYRALVGPLRRQAADAIRALGPAAQPPKREAGAEEGVSDRFGGLSGSSRPRTNAS